MKETIRIKTDEFDFPLPKERIAQRPSPFEQQRLLIYDRATKAIQHRLFSELPSLLRRSDLIVVNDSKVVPAALPTKDGKNLLIMDPSRPDMTGILAICPHKSRVGKQIEVSGGRFVVNEHVSGSIFKGDLIPEDECRSLQQFLEAHGTVPLPPYIRRPADVHDRTSYQTIFARSAGSIACPTAGLHFNAQLMSRLQEQGIESTAITLHVGYGTFGKFRTEFVDEHSAQAEAYHVSLQTLKRVNLALAEGQRVVAVGTTVTRTLESISDKVAASEGLTSDLDGESTLFIYPPFEFKVISGLITNLASPKNPVMSLAAAFITLEELKRIYKVALDNDYRFYSYGDALLLL